MKKNKNLFEFVKEVGSIVKSKTYAFATQPSLTKKSTSKNIVFKINLKKSAEKKISKSKNKRNMRAFLKADVTNIKIPKYSQAQLNEAINSMVDKYKETPSIKLAEQIKTAKEMLYLRRMKDFQDKMNKAIAEGKTQMAASYFQGMKQAMGQYEKLAADDDSPTKYASMSQKSGFEKNNTAIASSNSKISYIMKNYKEEFNKLVDSGMDPEAAANSIIIKYATPKSEGAESGIAELAQGKEWGYINLDTNEIYYVD